jgi:DNA-binding transcriptional regulator YiaG
MRKCKSGRLNGTAKRLLLQPKAALPLRFVWHNTLSAEPGPRRIAASGSALLAGSIKESMHMQNKNDPSVGERIREGRAKSGLSQLELAEKVNVSQPTISQWELGRQKPDSAQIEGLEAVLGGITKEGESSEQSLSAISIWLARAKCGSQWLPIWPGTQSIL